VKVIAHRGASRAARENSAEAFRRAVALGADAIELDVRRCRDGRLLVHHDPLPSPLPGGDDALLDLADALRACAGIAMVNVEIKNSADDPDHDPTMTIVTDTVATLRDHDVAGAGAGADRWLVSSFSRATIDACRTVAPELPTAWLVLDIGAADLAELAAAGHRAIHPWEPTVTAVQVAAAHDVGLAVNVWTCNAAERMLQLAEMGVDGVCTDVPDLALEVLGRG
jgi:glycerophosphoryl diester phosphodiesterase